MRVQTVLLTLLSTLYTVTHHTFQSLALHGEMGKRSLGLDIEQTLTKYLQTEEKEQKLSGLTCVRDGKESFNFGTNS